MSNGSSKTPQSHIYALSVQQTLRKYGPMTFDVLVQRTSLKEAQVRQGLRLSRRTISSPNFTNEIVATATWPGSAPVYFLTTSDKEAKSYEKRRRVIAFGHLASVIAIEEKRQVKYPNPQRAAAINMITMAQQLLMTAPIN